MSESVSESTSEEREVQTPEAKAKMSKGGVMIALAFLAGLVLLVALNMG